MTNKKFQIPDKKWNKIVMGLGTLVLGLSWLSCASESFDAPLDAKGEDPINLCAGVPAAFKDGCTLYDAFGYDLSRWNVRDSQTDDAPIRLLNVAADGHTGVLQTGHCPGRPVPVLETELRLQSAGQIVIHTGWRAADKDNPAVLRLVLDGEVLEYPDQATDSPPKWMSTAVTVTTKSARPILRVQAHSLSKTLCANVWVDWLAVTK